MADEEYERRLENLKQDVSELRSGLSGLIDDLRASKGEGESTMHHVSYGLNQGVDWVKDAVSGLRSSGQKAVENVQHKVEQRPLASLLMAFGVGMLLGRIMMRR